MKRSVKGLSILVATIIVLLLSSTIANAVAYQLSGRVTDGAGNPIPDTTIEIVDPSSSTIVTSTTTDATGNYAISVESGIYDILVTPPQSSGFNPSITHGQNITSGTTLDFVLVQTSVTIHGKVTDKQGIGLPGIRVNSYSADNGAGRGWDDTDDQGNYSFSISPDNVIILVANQNRVVDGLPYWFRLSNDSTPLNVNQDTTLNVQLSGFKAVTVHVQDPAGNPIANASVGTSSGSSNDWTLAGLPAVASSSDGTKLTDSDGNTTLWLVPSTYDISISPPSGSILSATTQTGTVIDSDTLVSITLPSPVTIHGKVTDKQGIGLPGIRVDLYSADNGAGRGWDDTDDQGNYSFSISPDNVIILVANQNRVVDGLPYWFRLSNDSTPLNVNQDTTLNVQLSGFKAVTVHVQDPAGNPIANASVGTSSGSSNDWTLAGLPAVASSSDGTKLTDSDGNTTLWLVPSTYDISISPPSGSILSATTQTGTVIDSDTLVSITLPSPVTIHGKVTDKQGIGLPGIRVDSYSADNGAGRGWDDTDDQGNYSFSISPDNVIILVANQNRVVDGLPYWFRLSNDLTPLNVNQDTTLNVQLSGFKAVTVHVQDPAGNPVANASVGTSSGSSNDWTLAGLPAVASSSDGTKLTDSDGNTTLWLVPSTYDISISPPSETPFKPFADPGVVVLNDRTIIVVLQFVHAPPSTSISLSPMPDLQGNYPGPVTVTLTANAIPGFTIANTYYKVDGDIQQIYTGPFTISEDGPHTIQYWSVDDYGVYETPKTRSFTIQGLRIITESPLPNGTVDIPYSVTLEAAGGLAPYTWSIAAGALPPGLALNPTTGEINGTPTTAGTFGFTVQVKDSSQTVVTKQFALAPPPSSGTAGSSYTIPISVPDTPPTGGSTMPTCSNYTVAGGELPPGLILDPTTGVISGTPVDGGDYTFTVQCVIETGQTATKEFTITINNPLPTITQLTPSSARASTDGFTLVVTGTNFVQSSVVNWNSSPRSTTYVSASELRAQITSDDIAVEGAASVTVVNPEPHGGTSNAATFTITPPNDPPTVDANGPFTVVEGSEITLTATGSDPNDDLLTYSWDLDNNGSFETPGQSVTFSAVDGSATRNVSVKVTDPGGLFATDEATVTIDNADPVISDLTCPAMPVQLGTKVSTTAAFTDPGVLDTHTALWPWGNGETSEGGVSETGGSGTVAGSHTYSTPGVYTVSLTVTDKDGGEANATCEQYVVIYDPSAGFVTGGGWIDSPAGAYTDDPTLTGKATFGFVAKYKKGANVPEGTTEFQFKVANLNFHSSVYDWLVVAGAKAQFKGTGTINGEGSYKFFITAIDGDLKGKGQPDKFRIRIFGVNGDGTEYTIYDNQQGEPIDADPVTSISGGSIVIHK